MLIVLSAVMAVLSPFFLSLSNFLNILLATSTIGVLAIAATYVIGSGGLDLSLGSVMGLAGVVGAYVAVELGRRRADRPARLHPRRRRRRLRQRRADHPRLRAGLHRHPRHARPGARPGAGHLRRPGDLRPAADDGLCRPGPPARHSDAGHHLRGDRRRRPLRARLHASSAATRWRSATARARRAPPASASSATAASSTRCRARSPGSPACCSWRASIPAIRPPALNYELTAITAAIIGGTNLFGGRASILGTMIGALIMGVLQNGLNLLAVQSYYQQMAIGAVLILAVFIDQYQIRKESRV